MNIKIMQMAIKEAERGVRKNYGGPFGAIIVKDGKVISRGHNEVIKSNNPTQHAEIVAIQRASKKLGRFDLSDCEIYSTCEPCPMCLSAIYWAKIKTLYYGCSKEDASDIGFDDLFIYDAINKTAKEQVLNIIQIERDTCLPLFNLWKNKPDKVSY